MDQMRRSSRSVKIIADVEQLCPNVSRDTIRLVMNRWREKGRLEMLGRGSGTLNIIDWCAENGNPPPVWSEHAGSVYVAFQPAALPDVLRGAEQVTAQVDAEHKANKIRILEGIICGLPGLTAQVTAQVLDFCREPRRASEIMEILKLKHWKTFQINYLNPLFEAGFIERTIPDKPRSSKQRYRLTKKSKALLDSAKKVSP